MRHLFAGAPVRLATNITYISCGTLLNMNPSWFLKGVRAFLLVTVILSHPTFSQDLVSLYKHYVPSAILENNESKRMASALLQGKANVHPDLIWYTLEQLNVLYGNKTKEERESIVLATRKEERNYKKRRNDWLAEENKKFDISESTLAFRSFAERYFVQSPLDTAVIVLPLESSISPDSNLMNYFHILYLRRDSLLRYDSSQNYRLLCEKVQDSIMSNYEALYSMLEGDSHKDNEHVIEELMSRWYIYEHADHRVPSQSTYHAAYQIVQRIISQEYSSNRNSGFTATLGYCFGNSLKLVEYELPVVYTEYSSYSAQSGRFPKPTATVRPSIKQIVASVGYKFPTGSSMGPFSYINLQLMASISLSGQDISNSSNDATSNTLGGLNVSQTSASHQDISIHSANCFVARVGTPLLMINKSLFLEATINTGLLSLSTSGSYSHSMNRTEAYWAGEILSPYYYTHTIATASGSGNLDLPNQYFVLYPTLELVGKISPNVQIRSIAGYVYFALLTEFSL